MHGTTLPPTLFALFALGGCGSGHDAPGAPGAPGAPAAAGHVHSPLFGGTLVELGEHFANLELVFDPETGTITLYLLSAHADGVVKGAQERIDVLVEVAGTRLELAATPRTSALADNSVGSSSQFQVQDDRLKGQASFALTARRIELLGSVFTDVVVRYPQETQR
jgi:hypothetical protein